MDNSRKNLGTSAELLVAAELERIGFVVSKPLGEHAAYDLVVDCGRRLARVQVKSTYTPYRRSNRDTPKFVVNLGEKGQYHELNTDFIVGVVCQAGAYPHFLIVPIGFLEDATSLVFDPADRTFAAGCYLNCWDAFSRFGNERRHLSLL